MPERVHLTGGPEEAAAQLCAHLGLDKLQPHNREKELEKLNVELIQTLEKMKEEREDIFEKNSALEDACGKLMKEKVFMQQEMVKAIQTMGELQKTITELRFPSKACGQSDQGHCQSTDKTPAVVPL